MPVPISKTILYPRDLLPNQVDDHIHEVLPRVGHRPLVPLDKTEVHTPLAKVCSLQTEVANTLLTEVRSWPPLVRVGNQLLPGLLLNCPLGQKEVMMANHGISGQCRKLQGKPADLRPLHTQSGRHRPG